MGRKIIHLVANAHIDPVWLWEWEEGAAEALSTFRETARLLEEFPDFIFCHNEAILYAWVEEYEPELFARIQRLVKEKKWHITGGWYLQPDCNMPSGESFVRQILLGKKYFKEKFGVEVKTATNLDPFGHTRGLVQIIAKSGFSSYLFCRPLGHECELKPDEFVWVGYDGSEILATRASAHYNSWKGKARHKVEEWMKNHPEKDLSILLWGVGNHGGGASREDLESLAALEKETEDFSIFHSTPEAFFSELEKKKENLARHCEDINPWAVGCYTSMIRVKQKHRQLENELFSAEKMASAAFFEGLMAYPEEEIREAMKALAFSEFHDLLPGSSIPRGEEFALRLLGHGLEILSRVKARAFFALASGQEKAREGEIPIFIYNPHPFRVEGLFECEFQPHEPNWQGGYLLPRIYKNEMPLPSQVEKEDSNLSLDWRKKVVFEASLEPSRMSRFSCRLQRVESRPMAELREREGKIHFRSENLEVLVNARTGLVDRLRIGEKDFLARNSFQPLVIEDNSDPWGMSVRSFRRVVGRFRLAGSEKGTFLSGVSKSIIPSVRVIEDGPVRSVVEAVFVYGNSLLIQRYKLPKKGTEIEVEIRVFWNEKDKMLKLRLPTLLKTATYIGQVAYGVAELPSNGDEAVAQKWVALVSKEKDLALTCINDGIHGSDFSDGEIRLSLLRSPAYSADLGGGNSIICQDRFVPRMEQGERIFHFWIKGGKVKERLEAIDREALLKNEKPFILAFFPPGTGVTPKPFITLSDSVIQVTAMKKAEDSDDLIIRLFEPTGKSRTMRLSLPFFEVEKEIAFSPFEIKTLKFRRLEKTFEEVDLLENPLNKNFASHGHLGNSS